MPRFTVFYMKPESFRTFNFGDVFPTLDELSTTHVELRTITETSLEGVYSTQQAEQWGSADPEKTNAFLASKGLRHTSMSMGDVARNDETGEFYCCARMGFVRMLTADQQRKAEQEREFDAMIREKVEQTIKSCRIAC